MLCHRGWEAKSVCQRTFIAMLFSADMSKFSIIRFGAEKKKIIFEISFGSGSFIKIDFFCKGSNCQNLWRVASCFGCTHRIAWGAASLAVRWHVKSIGPSMATRPHMHKTPLNSKLTRNTSFSVLAIHLHACICLIRSSLFTAYTLFVSK